MLERKRKTEVKETADELAAVAQKILSAETKTPAAETVMG